MNPFAIAKPRSYDEAAGLLKEDRFSLPVLKGGGIDLVDHLKEGLIEPDALIDVKKLGRTGIEDRGGRIQIGAGTTLAEIAGSRRLAGAATALAQSVEDAASPQVRNVATVAGNLLQRPRCWYYRNAKFDCTKKGGSMCYAREGENRYHAIFNEGPCVIVHPSNLAPALAVLDGTVHLTGGEREEMAISELFHMPSESVMDEHNLKDNEVITHLSISPAKASGFYAIKEKLSFDWPVAMAAVALDLDGATIRGAKVCAGAVAPIPWRLPAVEEALTGVALTDEAGLRKACASAVEGAEALDQNGYKLKLLPVAVRRAVLRAAGLGEVTP